MNQTIDLAAGFLLRVQSDKYLLLHLPFNEVVSPLLSSYMLKLIYAKTVCFSFKLMAHCEFSKEMKTSQIVLNLTQMTTYLFQLTHPLWAESSESIKCMEWRPNYRGINNNLMGSASIEHCRVHRFHSSHIP